MRQQATETTCPRCGAPHSRPGENCWLCQRSLPAGHPIYAETFHPNRKFSGQFTIASLLLATTLFAVCCAVVAMMPGLGILLAILSVPAFVRTGLVTQRRAQLGQPISLSRRVLWFLGSMWATTVVVTVVVVASVGTFCAVCLSAQSEAAIPVALLIAGVVTVGVGIASAKWIHRRWQRDTQQT